MKRLVICAGILIFLLAATLVNSWALERTSNRLSDLLEQAESLAESGDWAQAEALTLQAQQSWTDASDYLYIVLRHSDTDQVDTGFREVLELLRCRESGEYSSVNSRLTAQIRLLSEMEQFTLKNLL